MITINICTHLLRPRRSIFIILLSLQESDDVNPISETTELIVRSHVARETYGH